MLASLVPPPESDESESRGTSMIQVADWSETSSSRHASATGISTRTWCYCGHGPEFTLKLHGESTKLRAYGTGLGGSELLHAEVLAGVAFYERIEYKLRRRW
jgi:hypothetical protein